MKRIVYIVLAVVLMIGCNRHDHSDKQIFRYNESAGIATLDPAFAKDQSIIWPCRQLYNGLIELDSNLEVQPSVAKSWIGLVGGLLAILGVVAAPITSGDTALRSARLILADFLHLDQMKKSNRLAISVPMFALVALVLWFNVADEDGFNTIWRYFGWANQSLACFTLWALTAWLGRRKSLIHLVTLIPACFMTSVCLTYICVNKIGFNMPDTWIPYIAVLTAVVSAVLFYVLRNKKRLTQIDPEAWS